MNRFLAVIVALFFAYSCNENNAKTSEDNSNAAATSTNNSDKVLQDSANYTSLQWLDSVDQNLGKVKEGQVVEISWKFKNTGNKPLVVTNVSASCGCTVAEKPEQPIAPGEEGTIKAKYDSKGRSGMEHKNVYVVANSTGVKDHQLSFRLEVEKK